VAVTGGMAYGKPPQSEHFDCLDNGPGGPDESPLWLESPVVVLPCSRRRTGCVRTGSDGHACGNGKVRQGLVDPGGDGPPDQRRQGENAKPQRQASAVPSNSLTSTSVSISRSFQSSFKNSVVDKIKLDARRIFRAPINLRSARLRHGHD